MLSGKLKEICSFLNRLDRENDRRMTYRRILKTIRLSPNELAWLTVRLEEAGYIACTGRDFWGEPRGYRLLKSTDSISLSDLLRCMGMEELLFGGMESASGRLSAALGRMQEELKTIYISGIELQHECHECTEETENTYGKDGSGQDKVY
jgi:DNA-binding IscR family transcriptional regulator